MRVRKETAGCAGPDFLPSHRDRAQALRHTTRHKLREDTATPAWCWPSSAQIACELQSRALPTSRAPHLVSSDKGGATVLAITDVCPSKTPTKLVFDWCYLEEFSGFSSICRNKNCLVYGCCAPAKAADPQERRNFPTFPGAFPSRGLSHSKFQQIRIPSSS